MTSSPAKATLAAPASQPAPVTTTEDLYALTAVSLELALAAAAAVGGVR